MDSLLNDLLKNGILDETVIRRIKAMKDRSTDPAKPVEWIAQRREEYLKKMEMIEQAAIETDSDIYEYLIKGVTQGMTYSHLRADGLLCSKDYYYEQYRHFFWCLSRIRR